MNLINALSRADTIRLILSCDYRVDTDLPIDTITGSKTFFHCLTKPANTLSFGINSEVFQLPPAIINFVGKGEVGDDGTEFVKWTVEQALEPPISFSSDLLEINFSHVSGSILTKLLPELPPLTAPSCEGMTRSFFTFFQTVDADGSITIKGNHGTIVTLSNIKITANIGVTPLFDLSIVPTHNHHNDCGDQFDLVGETMIFKVKHSTNVNVNGLNYKWRIVNAVIGGAGIIGSNSLDHVQILLPDQAGTLVLSLEVTDQGTGFSDFFTIKMPFFEEEWYFFFEMNCDLRKIMRSRVLGLIKYDLENQAMTTVGRFPYTREELNTLSKQIRRVQNHLELLNSFNSIERSK